MSEISLEHPEFLILLDLIQARAIVSIPSANLFPSDDVQRQVVLQHGTATLVQRGLLQLDTTGKLLPNVDLVSIVTTVAFPKLVVLLAYNNHETGLQNFWFYQTDNQIVEHTITEEKLHRFTTLSDVSSMMNHIEEILSIKEVDPLHTSIEMDQTAFFTVKDLASRHEHEKAREALQTLGFNDQDAISFLNVLEQPLSAGNVAFLRCDHEAIIDARNLALLQDEHGAWSAKQRVPGEPILIVESTEASAIKEQLFCYFKDLSRV